MGLQSTSSLLPGDPTALAMKIQKLQDRIGFIEDSLSRVELQ